MTVIGKNAWGQTGANGQGQISGNKAEDATRRAPEDKPGRILPGFSSPGWALSGGKQGGKQACNGLKTQNSSSHKSLTCGYLR
jgi:hypothetical protein